MTITPQTGPGYYQIRTEGGMLYSIRTLESKGELKGW